MNETNNCPQSDNVFTAGPSGKSRGVAALLAIFIGSLGIQYFYLEIGRASCRERV